MNPAFKPYLLRAFYEWAVDEGWTPQISVVVDSHTRVPPGYAKEGQIVLNISPNACRNFFIHNDGVAFEARFSGAVHSIWVPIGRVVSIYSRESEEGVTFEVIDTPVSVLEVTPAREEPAPPPTKATTKSAAKRPSLKVVK